MPSSIRSRKRREPSGVLGQPVDRSKNRASLAAAAAKPAIQAPAHGCTAQAKQAALPLRTGRASRRRETRSNTQLPQADTQTHNLVVKFPRTIRALQSAGSPLPTTRQVPILRPCRFRKARGKSEATCNLEKKP